MSLDLEVGYEQALREMLQTKGLALHIDRVNFGERTYHIADIIEAQQLVLSGQTLPKRIYAWGMGADPRGALDDVMRRAGWSWSEVAG